MLKLAKIQLAEDFSSVRVLESVSITSKYTKFVQFWSSPWVLQAFRVTKLLSGEFRVFRGKCSLLALGVAMEIW